MLPPYLRNCILHILKLNWSIRTKSELHLLCVKFVQKI